MTRRNELLRRGGVPESTIDQVEAGGGDHAVLRFHALLDLAATEELGRRLAEELREMRPSRLLIAAERSDEILAFVVARELDAAVTTVSDSEGLLSHQGEVRNADRIVVLGDSFRSVEPLRALVAYVSLLGASVVAAAALIDTPALAQAAEELGFQPVALARDS